MTDSDLTARPVAVVTGASRQIGIGAAIARQLLTAGWGVATTYWRPYDARMPWGSDPDEMQSLDADAVEFGGRVIQIEADLSAPEAPARIFAQANEMLGPVQALVMSHCDGVDAGILDTTVEDFDRVMTVNARASWLLIRHFAEQFSGTHGSGRIVALTSDHTAGNLAYGSSKGALDRIVIAAATELADLGITANVINPGPTDTGWMDKALETRITDDTLLSRIGQPKDCANLVTFLCSPAGGWINGQLLMSDGGRRVT